jgi:hypothetical protein
LSSKILEIIDRPVLMAKRLKHFLSVGGMRAHAITLNSYPLSITIGVSMAKKLTIKAWVDANLTPDRDWQELRQLVVQMAKDLEQAIICVDEDRRIETGEKKNSRTPQGKEFRDNLIKRVRQNYGIERLSWPPNAVSEYLREIGSKGGSASAGTAKAKVRASKAGRARWANHSPAIKEGK